MLLVLSMVVGTLTVFSATSTPASAEAAYNFVIKNYATGDCLVRPQKVSDHVYLAPCSGSPNERWGSRCSDWLCYGMQFYNLANGKCLTGASPAPGASVGLFTCSTLGAREVWWGQVSDTLQAFRFANSHQSDQCLAQISSANVALEPCSLSTTQFWTILFP
ncbi:RICIN domain-containing protein [Actinocorallia herbida]|uniref:RICIN domain-containing protein n=1 Tax=Actinocorallia herbida TaxID=58109 RepID=UPI001476B453|nr:RICIN domain-containing protein [Actinocorallia herbida]